MPAVNQTGAAAPRLTTATDGTVWLVWSDSRSGNSDIYLSRLAADGQLSGSTYLVNHDGAGHAQQHPALSADEDGRLFLAWEDNRDGDWDIYVQRFDPAAGYILGATIAKRTGWTPETSCSRR